VRAGAQIPRSGEHGDRVGTGHLASAGQPGGLGARPGVDPDEPVIDRSEPRRRSGLGGIERSQRIERGLFHHRVGQLARRPVHHLRESPQPIRQGLA
jgi:hypothetical protein